MLKIGARPSLLSRAQVLEMARLLPFVFEPVWIATQGDVDQSTSLRTLGSTNFFTKELDDRVLEGSLDAAIHSAKDLPIPLAKGLQIALLTEGLDPRDSLVIKKEPIEWVATSSQRREEAVAKLFPHCRFVDLRGTIEERLAKEVDGVVIAEAALIRLNLMHLRRIFLPLQTAPLQGKLALVCREGDDRFQNLISRA